MSEQQRDDDSPADDGTEQSADNGSGGPDGTAGEPQSDLRATELRVRDAAGDGWLRQVCVELDELKSLFVLAPIKAEWVVGLAHTSLLFDLIELACDRLGVPMPLDDSTEPRDQAPHTPAGQQRPPGLPMAGPEDDEQLIRAVSSRLVRAFHSGRLRGVANALLDLRGRAATLDPDARLRAQFFAGDVGTLFDLLFVACKTLRIDFKPPSTPHESN